MTGSIKGPTVTDAKLEPCPFCGPRPEDSGEWPQLFEHSSECVTEYSVRCGCCGIELGDEYREEAIRLWNTRTATNRASEGGAEIVSEAIHDFLDARFPEGAMPGGKQLFADDHLDAEFKHEAGCDEMARFILDRLTAKPDPEPTRTELVEALRSARRRLAECQAKTPGHFSNAETMRGWLAEIDALLSREGGSDAAA